MLPGFTSQCTMPASNTATAWRCRNEAEVGPSSKNRSRLRGSADSASRASSTFTATRRPSRSSTAANTREDPPVPICSANSYRSATRRVICTARDTP